MNHDEEDCRTIIEVPLGTPAVLKKEERQGSEGISDLITGQYEFLVTQLEKVLKDYFELSARVKEMHTEMFGLKEQLARSLSEQCTVHECLSRQ